MITDYENIAISKPINKTASKIVNKGLEFNIPDPPENVYFSDKPLPFRRWKGGLGKDYAGERFGRVVIVGYLGRQSGKGRWLYRCDCGMYGTGKIEPIKNDSDFKCYGCKYMDNIKKNPARNVSKELKKRNSIEKHYGAEVLRKYDELSYDDFDAFIKDLKSKMDKQFY